MKIVSDDYHKTFELIRNKFKSHNYNGMYEPYVTLENLEMLNIYYNPDRLNSVFKAIEYDYDRFHKDDEYNKINYFFKLLCIITRHNDMITNLSDESLSLLVTSIPFEMDTDKYLDRFAVVSSDDLLAEVRLLSNRYMPMDTISIFLQQFDKKKINDKTVGDEIDKAEKNKHKYFDGTSYMTGEEYRKYLQKEDVKKR